MDAPNELLARHANSATAPKIVIFLKLSLLRICPSGQVHLAILAENGHNVE